LETEHWRKVERLFYEALEKDGPQRVAFLEQACAGDGSLASEVNSLLAGGEASGSFLENPAMEVAARTMARSRGLPAAIGRYKIVGLLGEGGMGSVYEAEQEEPRRSVALKVIRAGLTTPERLRRFRHESQALGRLQHPGIAQIYEASTAETPFGPQPYFAMELVHGLPLDKYAEANRLSIRQRLALIARICEAVEHAHQRGLIHRDLKPGNILVDGGGQPKILDFGVARVAGADEQPTEHTDLGQLVGTLPYMSPEQVLGDPLEIDTRSDVYSLGVILYELLAGRPPHDVKHRPLPEAVRAIRDEDPASLSSISREHRGDVETIVAKALEKDKTRRYASAAALGADIERYLKDEPIAARPPSATYQLAKFARRNRVVVAGVAAVFVVLVAGIAVSSTEAIRANRAGAAAVAERDRALAAERSAEAVTDFLRNDMLRQASLIEQGPEAKPDPDLKVRTALDRAAARIPGKFAGQPAVEADIRTAIGTTYLDLGLRPEAEIQMQRVLELRRNLKGEDDPDTALAMNNLASLYMEEGKTSKAEPLLAQASKIRIRVLGEKDPVTLVTMGNLASLYRVEGKYPEAEAQYRKVLEIRRRVLGENNRDTGSSYHNLASLYGLEGKFAEAEPLEARAFAIWRVALGEEHPLTLRSKSALQRYQRELPQPR
jgi:eukaryotic-like serine/threonine-protein kinase